MRKKRDKIRSIKVSQERLEQNKIEQKARLLEANHNTRYNIVMFLNSNDRYSEENVESVFAYFMEQLEVNQIYAQLKLNLLFSIFASNKLKYNLIDEALRKEIEDQTDVIIFRNQSKAV